MGSAKGNIYYFYIVNIFIIDYPFSAFNNIFYIAIAVGVKHLNRYNLAHRGYSFESAVTCIAIACDYAWNVRAVTAVIIWKYSIINKIFKSKSLLSGKTYQQSGSLW